MKRHYIVTLLVLLSVISAVAQKTVADNNPALHKQLDSLFSYFNNKNSPGFAVSVIKNGKAIARRNYGLASIEFKVPFDHNTVVRLPYSEGREFVSIAAAMMEQQGLLSFNDKVRKYFPRLPQWAEGVTIQDLLNHSSGFCDEWATLVLTQAEMANRLDLEQFLNLLYSQPDPQVEPGKGYMYSNSDFGLLRLILDKACGKNLSVYMQEKMFAPLRMSQTSLGRNKEAVLPRHALSYAEVNEREYRVWMRDKTSPGGNYWILTSAADLEKWAAAHADPNSFIAKATQRLKQNARPIPVLKNGINYVFGHKIKQIAGKEIIKHEGVSGYSFLTEIPAAGLSIICIGNNLDPYSDKTDAIAGFLLKEKNQSLAKRTFPSKTVPISRSEMRQYEGTYQWLHQTSFQSAVERKQFSELRVIGDSMWLIYSAVDSFPLVYVGDGIFKDPDYPIWTVMYKPHPDSPMKSTVHRQTAINDSIEWKQVTAVKKRYSREDLQKITGTYYSKHLDFYWRIELNDQGDLVLKRPTIADKIIEPSYDNDFKLPIQFHTDDESWAWVTFHFDDTGKVQYLDVRHSRLMHHRFDKR